MRINHTLLFFLSFTFLLIFSINADAQNSGNNYFSSSQIHTIKITSSLPLETFYDSMSYYKDQANLTDDNTYMKVEVEIDGTTVTDIGIRMKGNSSYNMNSKKKSLKLSFDEYVDDQEYDGMGTLNLNNCMWDPTLMREKVSLDFMNEFGVYAPRCTYANVYLNDVLWGLYSTVEQVDKKFLNTLIGENDGNLFKAGDDGGEFSWYGSNQVSYENYFELKTNDSLNDWTDLINFIDILNNTSASTFESELEAVFNVDGFLKYWAVSNLLTNLDSYLESTRNYYIYHNLLTDKFDWIAWDLNEAFGVYTSMNFPNTYEYPWDETQGRILLEKLINVTSYKAQYTDYLNILTFNYLDSTWFDDKIDAVHDLIQSSVYSDTLKMFTDQDFEDNIDQTVTVTSGFSKSIPGLKDFLDQRYDYMSQELYGMGYNSIHESLNNNKILVYPNPASDYIYVKNEDNQKPVFIQIKDLMGKNVLSQQMNNNEFINVKFLSSGLYTYTLFGQGFPLITDKLLIQK
jgi:hypothetical protein